MSPYSEIENLQQQVNELSNQLQQSQQKLLIIQQQLQAIQGKIIFNENINTVSTQQNSVVKHSTPVPNYSHNTLENFIGLRVIHLVGIIVLLIGISIGVKYAIDKNLITPLARILLAYSASTGLLVLSILLRKKYDVFSAILFSGAMASAYFTTYGAFVYYNILTQTLSFLIMIALAIYTAVKALQYNKQEIALLGMIGAYAIPLLISSNHENYMLLFSYILVMNAGILFISFNRSWKTINMLALLITWIFLIGWLLFKYKMNEMGYALLFMFVYYILFMLASFAFTVTKKILLGKRQLLQILLNNVAFYISLLSIFQAAESNSNAALVTCSCALLFLAFALAGNNFFHKEKILNRMHYAEALILSVLFVSIQCSGLTLTLLWVLIAIIVFVLGITTKTTWPRLAAIILLGFTLLKLLIIDSISFTAVQKIIAYLTIGTLLLILSFFYQKFKQVLFENSGGREND